MFSQQIEFWPCHPKPQPDELLSSWLVRIAHANRLKVQTFCDLVFGRERQIWNRDIDRLAPRWITHRLSAYTGTPLADAYQTSLGAYRGLLYPYRKESGILRWILPLNMWHRKRKGFGLQYCPACLAEDEHPYYRKRWRVAFYTCCTLHNTLLWDRCPECGAEVAFHRVELGHYERAEDWSLARCHACRFDLRSAPVEKPVFYEASSQSLMLDLLHLLEGRVDSRFDIGFLGVLHQMCKIMLTRIKHVRLHGYVTEQVNAPSVVLLSGRISFEEHSLRERHHVMQLAAWLLADPAKRITDSWQSKAVRYNLLKKDFNSMPRWYHEILICSSRDPI